MWDLYFLPAPVRPAGFQQETCLVSLPSQVCRPQQLLLWPAGGHRTLKPPSQRSVNGSMLICSWGFFFYVNEQVIRKVENNTVMALLLWTSTDTESGTPQEIKKNNNRIVEGALWRGKSKWSFKLICHFLFDKKKDKSKSSQGFFLFHSTYFFRLPQLLLLQRLLSGFRPLLLQFGQMGLFLHINKKKKKC